MNPVKYLIEKHLKEHNLKRSELAVRLGYKSITGGLRKLDWLIDNPRLNHPLLPKLLATLQIPDATMSAAIIERQQFFKTQQQKRFKPFIQTIVSSRPSPIFVAAVVPKFWNIPVDTELQNLSYDEEIKAVVGKYQKLQLEHAVNKHIDDYAKLVVLLNNFDRNNEPYSWMFGKGFRYFRKHDETIVFNRECEIQLSSKTEIPVLAYVTI
jgi:hypothetical protein